jgi:hypothetical protein
MTPAKGANRGGTACANSSNPTAATAQLWHAGPWYGLTPWLEAIPQMQRLQ